MHKRNCTQFIRMYRQNFFPLQSLISGNIKFAIAGIRTDNNIAWLKTKGYDYIAVSRRRKKEIPPGLEMVTVRQNNSRVIRAAMHQKADEMEVYCHSSAREIKETGTRTRFESRFEDALENAGAAHFKKAGRKNTIRCWKESED